MATLLPYLGWKEEPASPGFASPDHETDFWGLNDDVTSISLKVEKDEPTASKSAAELLDELDEWIKEEPFAVWLEEKIDLPLLDIPVPEPEPYTYNQPARENAQVVKTPAALDVKIPQQCTQYVAGDTQSLLQEFESVFGEVELNPFTLTPPQSPTHPHLQPVQVTQYPTVQSQYARVFSQDPNGSPLFITTLQQIVPLQTVPTNSFHFASVPNVVSSTSSIPSISVSYTEKKETLIPNLEQIVPSPAHDIDEELAAVDELIRTRVEDLETSFTVEQEPAIKTLESEVSANSPFNENVAATLEVVPPSPSTTSNSSFDSVEDLADDPEWVPLPVHGLSHCEKVTGSRKRTAKPYARIGTEEKRLRKKEQNKNAATRYRQKKKAEVEVILGEEKQLADANEELQEKVNDLSREIKYLKGLMRDVFKAKGLLK